MFETSEGEVEQLASKNSGQQGSGGTRGTGGTGEAKQKAYVIRMRGLPFTATIPDVTQFFAGCELVASPENKAIMFTTTQDGRPTGEAFVEFASEEDQKEALKRHRNKIGSRYIELFVSSKDDMTQAPSQLGYNQFSERRRVSYTPYHQHQGPASGPAAVTDGTTLKLRGLPFSAGVDEVIEFFKGEN